MAPRTIPPGSFLGKELLMVRSLVRSGLVALFVLSLSMPAQAAPLAGERESFTSSLSALWERLVSPIVALWTGGGPVTCNPNGKAPASGGGGATDNSSGVCDPNG